MIDRQFFTTDEMLALPNGAMQISDVEIYENYFLLAFKDYASGKYGYFEAIDDETIPADWIYWFLSTFCQIGFNWKKFDLVILSMAQTGKFSIADLKRATHEIIIEGARPHDVAKAYGFRIAHTNNVDLIEVAPLQGSLKVYGARLHCRHMQDLPFHPDLKLNREQMAIVRTYCFNDLDNTELLLKSLEGQLDLRAAMSAEYGQDLRSKSDAQIAEAVIIAEVEKITGATIKRPSIDPAKAHVYNVPQWMCFETPQLRAILETVRNAKFHVDETGVMRLPPELEGLAVPIGSAVYRMGIGGLHSSEVRQKVEADDDWLLIDRDVTGYYPNIILSLGLFPAHIGEVFLQVYRAIVDRRTLAKKLKDYITAESLKITTNGSFGKFGSPYSLLYAPDLMVQVTLTGQLALLMLIEKLEGFFIQVTSANTDGITIKCRNYDYPMIEKIFSKWEKATGFETEETRYKGVYSRDVNNYIAIMADGTQPKTKGAYSNPWDDPKKQIFRLFKNPQNMIAIDAAVAHIANGTPISATIRGCAAIERFVVVRAAKGGASKDGRYLGKVIRWYYAKDQIGAIVYASSGNKIALSENGKPLMTLPDNLPDDIDYEKYENLAIEILEDVGYQRRRNEQLSLM